MTLINQQLEAGGAEVYLMTAFTQNIQSDQTLIRQSCVGPIKY